MMVFMEPFLFKPPNNEKLDAAADRPRSFDAIVPLRFAMLRLLWLRSTLCSPCYSNTLSRSRAVFKRSKLRTGRPRMLLLFAALFFSNAICRSREIPILYMECPAASEHTGSTSTLPRTSSFLDFRKFLVGITLAVFGKASSFFVS